MIDKKAFMLACLLRLSCKGAKSSQVEPIQYLQGFCDESAFNTFLMIALQKQKILILAKHAFLDSEDPNEDWTVAFPHRFAFTKEYPR